MSYANLSHLSSSKPYISSYPSIDSSDFSNRSNSFDNYINTFSLNFFDEKFDFECFSETDLASIHHQSEESTSFYTQAIFSSHIDSIFTQHIDSIFIETNDLIYQSLMRNEIQGSQISVSHDFAVFKEPIFTMNVNGILHDGDSQEPITSLKVFNNLPR